MFMPIFLLHVLWNFLSAHTLIFFMSSCPPDPLVMMKYPSLSVVVFFLEVYCV